MNDRYYELLFTNKEFDLHFNSRLSKPTHTKYIIYHKQQQLFISNNCM